MCRLQQPMSSAGRLFGVAAMAIVAACVLACNVTAAEAIKIGTLRQAYYGPVFIAQERGYFAAEGLASEIVYFDAGPPIAVAVAAGSLDFGVDGTSGALFSLCGQGVLRMIGGNQREHPGFQILAFFASNRAYAAGLKSYRDFAGHSAAVTQIGAPSHYDVVLAAEKYGFDLKQVRILPLQSISAILSALTGGTADFGPLPATTALATIQRGDAKLIAWVGDETPWQMGATFTATRTADERPATVERFLRALRKAERDYHDAFAGADERRQDNPSAAAVLKIIAAYADQPVELAAQGVGYIDPEGRVDVKDVAHQIAWFKSQGMLKGPVGVDQVIDQRYAIPLPER